MPKLNCELPSPPEEAGPISLQELLGYENPHRQEYQELIDELERRTAMPPGDRYASDWLKVVNPNYSGAYLAGRRFLEERLRGELLIDLGGGYTTGQGATPMGYVAETLGVKTFINVDRFLATNLPADLYTDLSGKVGIIQPAATRVIAVQADMLDFISRLPANSANFTLNGIDTIVIQNPKYHRAIASELERTTKPGGIVFGINSDAIYKINSKQFETLQLDKLHLPINTYGVMIVEKKR